MNDRLSEAEHAFKDGFQAAVRTWHALSPEQQGAFFIGVSSILFLAIVLIFANPFRDPAWPRKNREKRRKKRDEQAQRRWAKNVRKLAREHQPYDDD